MCHWFCWIKCNISTLFWNGTKTWKDHLRWFDGRQLQSLVTSSSSQSNSNRRNSYWYFSFMLILICDSWILFFRWDKKRFCSIHFTNSRNVKFWYLLEFQTTEFSFIKCRQKQVREEEDKISSIFLNSVCCSLKKWSQMETLFSSFSFFFFVLIPSFCFLSCPFTKLNTKTHTLFLFDFQVPLMTFWILWNLCKRNVSS